jgi:formylglycine-generating enzyme required for sulfatase activity
MRSVYVAVLTSLALPSLITAVPAAVAAEVALGGQGKGSITVKLPRGTTMEFALIPAGKFLMGSPGTEVGRYPDEGPKRTVSITCPFYIGIHEVTQEQYIAITGVAPSKFKGNAKPAEYVSWDDAVDFCKQATRKTGRSIRLPTEAEWEYACRAGGARSFSFGDDDRDLAKHAWFRGNSDRCTHTVGEKLPNAWGLYDMHGNVAEWCADRYAPKYDENTKTDPQGPSAGQFRVVRGGAWLSEAKQCRSAARDWRLPGHRFSFLGFRVVIPARKAANTEDE